MSYTLQVSNHPGAGQRLCTQAAIDSWETIYDGPIESAKAAREAVDGLANWYKHARAFRGNHTIGKLWYAVLRMS